MEHNLANLRRQCPLPVLMAKLGLEQFAKPSCPSPFRREQNASWGIFESPRGWHFKDFGTGDSGDEIDFLARHHGLDSKRDFIKLLEIYARTASQVSKLPILQLANTTSKQPDTSFLTAGTDEQIRRLSELRAISVAGLNHARQKGVLKFGRWQNLEVYGVVDDSGNLAEVRRLDGGLFAGYGAFAAYKNHTLKHSRKNWPLGIQAAQHFPAIALVEGLPDFLALHQFIVEEGMVETVAPVAMLTGSCDLASETLPLFAGKHVRVFPHNDGPGIASAERWERQLLSAPVRHLDFVDFRAFEIAVGSVLNDLCDFNRQRSAAGLQTQRLLDISVL